MKWSVSSAIFRIRNVPVQNHMTFWSNFYEKSLICMRLNTAINLNNFWLELKATYLLFICALGITDPLKWSSPSLYTHILDSWRMRGLSSKFHVTCKLEKNYWQLYSSSTFAMLPTKEEQDLAGGIILSLLTGMRHSKTQVRSLHIWQRKVQ